MRNFLTTVSILFASTAALTAAPINYNINFTLDSGNLLPSSGSFTYDAATPLFTGFIVLWNSTTYDLTAAANSPSTISLPSCLGGATGPAASFALLSQSGCTRSSTPGPFDVHGWSAVAGTTGGLSQFVLQHNDTAPGIYIAFAVDTANLGTTNRSGSGQWSITPTTSAVPEPSTLAMTILAGVLLVAVRRVRH